MGEALDIHHLFPQSWCINQGIHRDTYDSAVNKSPISYKANRKIGGDAPALYLKKIQKDTQVSLSDMAMDEILESHLIDPGTFRSNDFAECIHLRSLKLVELIYEAMGKKESMPDEIALFGYGSEAQKEAALAEMMKSGESSILEFKSSLRWNIKSGEQDNKIEEIILKSIAAFNNAYGGTLIIGVNDESKVLGLDQDYKTLREANKDHFELHLRNLVNEHFGTDFATSRLEIQFPRMDNKEICQIKIKRGRSPKYLKVISKNGVKSDKFYVRSGNSSPEMPLDEAAKYISERFRGMIS